MSALTVDQQSERAAPKLEHPSSVGHPRSSASLNALRLAFLALLLYSAAVLIYPFSSVILWSTALSVSLYPTYEWLAARLNGRRRLAAILITLFTLLLLTLPAIWIAVTMAEGVRAIYESVDVTSIAVPAPPASIKSWPLVGDEIYRLWTFAIGNFGELLVKIAPQLKSAAASFLRIGADAGLGAISFVVSIVVMGLVLPSSSLILRYVGAFAGKLDPIRGEKIVGLIGATIRAVARGVVGISVLQTVLAAIGFAAGGIPQVSLLAFAVLVAGIVQIGAAFVIIPVIVWSWTLMDTTPAVLFTVYMLAINSLDNILKPFLMGRGLQTPVVAILIGVVGGALVFGLAGVFLGPIILAVLWALFVSWIDESGES
jgi:predicted PurR-regulated permease PerM